MTSLNPNAAEFIPSAFRSPPGSTKSSDITRWDVSGPSANLVLDRSESNISSKSDDEAQRYWRDQLPDDITLDFKSMVEEDVRTTGQLSLANLSLHDSAETSRFLTSVNSQLFRTDQDISSQEVGNLSFGENVGHTGREGHHYNGDSGSGLLNDFLNEQTLLNDASVNPVKYLASLFPGFAAESLADVFYANGCDLNLTVEILTQLELQVDTNFGQNTNPKSAESPSFNMLDFPVLTPVERNSGMSAMNGGDLQSAFTYKSCSNVSRGANDYASTVRKLASQDSANRKYERSSSIDGLISSSRNSQFLNSSYNDNNKLSYGDKVESSAAGRAAPVWLETGNAVANLYSELREDARDFARLRNACFEQARQAYLIGNGSLAKELSRKGQLYNMQMKAAHGKARESIYRQRNPTNLDSSTQNRIIDLHGLHVNEAIQVLQHELSILKSTARSSGQRLQVMICVGTGHHTKGARTPARLPVAVEQFLLEGGLHFTQPQPGLLRVVIY